uniref:Inositol 1,4,5-trisphosphate/ryanodine receptor domain-containing protein n=1 Tax=Xenopus tropicalis TaxID=8364 RepID=A0A803JTU8_XENTR
MAEGGEVEDEIQFLRTDDEVVLQCVATIHKEQRKFCLAAEGLGNRLCFLEPTSEAKYVPPDLCICNFVLEQSLSVRALQEMLANTMANGNEGPSDLSRWVRFSLSLSLSLHLSFSLKCFCMDLQIQGVMQFVNPFTWEYPVCLPHQITQITSQEFTCTARQSSFI